jgi:hypothetical protein
LERRAVYKGEELFYLQIQDLEVEHSIVYVEYFSKSLLSISVKIKSLIASVFSIMGPQSQSISLT